MRNVLPDLLSNTLEVVKLTSLGSVVAMPELLFQARQAQSLTYSPTPILLSDYPEALQNFFTYIAKSDLRDSISFADYYSKDAVGNSVDRIQIIDPVNAKNNTARLYADNQATAIIDAALEAGDAIDSGLAAITKQDTVRYWQKVFGPTFSV